MSDDKTRDDGKEKPEKPKRRRAAPNRNGRAKPVNWLAARTDWAEGKFTTLTELAAAHDTTASGISRKMGEDAKAGRPWVSGAEIRNALADATTKEAIEKAAKKILDKDHEMVERGKERLILDRSILRVIAHGIKEITKPGYMPSKNGSLASDINSLTDAYCKVVDRFPKVVDIGKFEKPDEDAVPGHEYVVAVNEEGPEEPQEETG